MGCDIHCYIEYKDKNAESWSHFGGRINPGRCYWAFSRLAGVRGEGGPAPKGFPEDASYAARNDNYLYIVDSYEDQHTVNSRKAAHYVEKCGSNYIKDRQGVNRWVTQPDWHSHSWATPDEWAAICTPEIWTKEYAVILAALRAFEAQGCDARVVYWFDN